MIVIADSGSTKADWKVVPLNGNAYMVSTRGFNPYYNDSAEIALELKKEFALELPVEKVTKVFYYGAGCSDKHRCDIVADGLKEVFPNAHIEVDHDLLAAARATCGNEPGIACIIGTGSNTCLYDGKNVIDNVTNLGFLIGDEGSGAYLGKTLVRSYFYREMPPDLMAEFEKRFVLNDNKRAIIDEVYAGSPNVYLATFARFIAEFKDTVYIQNLVYRAFELFIDRHVRKYKNHNNYVVHFVGSIAYHFQNILETVLVERGLKMGIIVRKPIEELVVYHLKNN